MTKVTVNESQKADRNSERGVLNCVSRLATLERHHAVDEILNYDTMGGFRRISACVGQKLESTCY